MRWLPILVLTLGWFVAPEGARAQDPNESNLNKFGMDWSYVQADAQPNVRRPKAGFIASATVMAAGGVLIGVSYIEVDWIDDDWLCFFPPCEYEVTYPWHRPVRITGVAMLATGAAATIATGVLWGVRRNRAYSDEGTRSSAPRRVQWEPAKSRLVF